MVYLTNNILSQSQGQTLEEVLIDFGEGARILNGLFYTAISRVKTGNSLFLRKFQPDYIMSNPDVEKKIKAMSTFSPYQFKKIRLDRAIFVNAEELKIGYINIRSLMKGRSLEFLNNDRNLNCLNFLVVADTGLDHSTSTEYLANNLSNWRVLHRYDAEDGHQHMGLLVLQGQSCSVDIKLEVTLEKKGRTQDDKSVYVQVLKVYFKGISLSAAFVYINHTPTSKEVDKLLAVLNSSDSGHAELVMGDLNMDMDRAEDKEKLRKICGEYRCQILKEITTDNWNQLDQVIIAKNRVKHDAFSTSYYNYTSDHKAIVVRIPNTFNLFSTGFKKVFNLDENKETRIGQKRKAEPCNQSPKRVSKPKSSSKRKSKGDDDEASPKKITRRVPVHQTLPTLNPEMMTLIKETLDLPPNEAVVNRYNIVIHTTDILDLKVNENGTENDWLNDNIINFMFKIK